MTKPTPNTLAWFEVATDDPDAAVAFYTDLFGWTFEPFANPEEAGIDYRVASQQDGGPPFGGILATGGAMPPHAVFSIAVGDIAAICDATAKLGGTVVLEDLAPKAGPPNAYLRDPLGNLFGVFAPPSA
jgi:uncharacterized protein